MATPKLRFKEFDGDWSESKLKDCIDSIDSGWSPQCESYPADENEWAVLKTTSVDWDGFKANFNKKLPSNLEARFEIEVKPNDILVTRAGPTERVGVVAVVPHNVRSKLMISDKLIRLKADNENNPEFLGISLSSVKCQNQLQSKTSGLAKSQTNISQKILCDVSLMTPAKAEQTKIASFLSAVDEKISQLTQKHELLSQYKQGMMQKLFSQQIRFKADDGSEFGEWNKFLLGDCVDILTNGLSLDQNMNGNGFKVTRIETISNFNIDLSRVGYVDTQSDISSYRLVVGDILFSNINSIAHIGKVVYIDKDYDIYHGMNLLRIQFKKNLDKKFMFYELSQKTFKQHFESIANKAVNQASINQTALKKTELCAPCLEEQIKIANFLSAIDQKIEVVAEQIEQAKTWKKGLLQQMFI